ncbi:unnamed protein product [Lampetra planeri]
MLTAAIVRDAQVMVGSQPTCASPQPVRVDATVMTVRDGVVHPKNLLPKLHAKVPVLKKTLLCVKEFAAAVGAWAVFRRQFTATCELAGWTDAEALRALPTTLNDDALGPFYAIPPKDREMLQQALVQMVGIFDPPSNVRISSLCDGGLMALAQAAYPRMDVDGLDSLVLERLLRLAKDPKVTLPATEDDETVFTTNHVVPTNSP